MCKIYVNARRWNSYKFQSWDKLIQSDSEVCHMSMTLNTTFFNQLCHRQFSVWTCTNPVKMVFSLEAWVFMVEQVFYYGGVYTEEVKYKFVEMFSISHIPHLNIIAAVDGQFHGNWFNCWCADNWQDMGINNGQNTEYLWLHYAKPEEIVTASRHLIFINTERT
jgi:hypothetical protein